MKTIAILALALVVAAVATPARALTCNSWSRLGPDQRAATIQRMISNAVEGSGGRSYHIDRSAVGRCLERAALAIGYDFDGACSDSRSAGMQALNKIFKDYIWSCAG